MPRHRREGFLQRPCLAGRCFQNLAVADARRAGANTFARTIDERVDSLKVQIPTSIADVVGVADFMPELRSTAADFTNFCHKNRSQFAGGKLVKPILYQLKGFSCKFSSQEWTGVADKVCSNSFLIERGGR